MPPKGQKVLDSKPRVPHRPIVNLDELSKKHRLRQKELEQFILVRFFAVWAHGESWKELLTREELAAEAGRAAKEFLSVSSLFSSSHHSAGVVGFACRPGTYSLEDKTL